MFDEKSPSRDVLKHVTSRWGVLVLVALLCGGIVDGRICHGPASGLRQAYRLPFFGLFLGRP